MKNVLKVGRIVLVVAGAVIVAPVLLYGVTEFVTEHGKNMINKIKSEQKLSKSSKEEA